MLELLKRAIIDCDLIGTLTLSATLLILGVQMLVEKESVVKRFERRYRGKDLGRYLRLRGAVSMCAGGALLYVELFWVLLYTRWAALTHHILVGALAAAIVIDLLSLLQSWKRELAA